MNKRLLKKAFRDLYSDRKKAVVAMTAIVIGMISFGSILFSYEIITNELITTYSSINPPSGSISVNQIDDRFIELTQSCSDIAEFEIKTHYKMRGQNADGEWATVEMFASDNYADLALNKVFYMKGSINPAYGEMLIERDAIHVSGKSIGDILSVVLPDGNKAELKITGIINDLGVHPATMHNTIYTYVSMETLESMGLSPNKVDFKIIGNPYDRQNIMTIGNEYMRMLEQNGYHINSLEVEDIPGISMHLEEYRTALFMLRAFAFVAFLFGCLIMSSLITAILSQQVKQIGILKSFGTKTFSITVSYLLALFSFIGIAGLISLPLSKVLANQLSSVLIRLSNMTLTHTQISPLMYVVFLFSCFVIPLMVAFLSIRRAAKISVKDAISNSHIADNKISANMFMKFSKVQRPVALSLRNAFRRKNRFLLNVSTLAISGVCFITVFVSMFSVSKTLNDNMNTFEYDYQFVTGNADKKQTEQILEKNTEIKQYESWGLTSGKYLYHNGETGNAYPIYAIPQNSQVIVPDLLEGEWLDENIGNGVVVGHEFLQNHSDVSVGENIVLDVDGKSLEFAVIGVIKDFSGSNIYMNERFYSENISSQSGQNIVYIQLASTLRGRSKANLINKLEEALLEQGVPILQSETKDNAAEILSSHYMTTFKTFLIIIFMVLIVSSFGLSSTANIQALERMKEIGIMKAMGADNKQIIQIITSESIFVGLCGWVLSALFAVPGIAVGITYFSNIMLEVPLTINWIAVFAGYMVWLLLVLVIGKAASRRSALRAANMTIKECLSND